MVGTDGFKPHDGDVTRDFFSVDVFAMAEFGLRTGRNNNDVFEIGLEAMVFGTKPEHLVKFLMGYVENLGHGMEKLHFLGVDVSIGVDEGNEDDYNVELLLLVEFFVERRTKQHHPGGITHREKSFFGIFTGCLVSRVLVKELIKEVEVGFCIVDGKLIFQKQPYNFPNLFPVLMELGSNSKKLNEA
jgi:hypothetical protein